MRQSRIKRGYVSAKQLKNEKHDQRVGNHSMRLHYGDIVRTDSSSCSPEISLCLVPRATFLTRRNTRIMPFASAFEGNDGSFLTYHDPVHAQRMKVSIVSSGTGVATVRTSGRSAFSLNDPTDRQTQRCATIVFLLLENHADKMHVGSQS